MVYIDSTIMGTPTMRTSKRQTGTWYCAMFVFLTTSVGSCSRNVETEQQSTTGGASLGTGGSSIGGTSAGSMSAGGSSADGTGGTSTGGSPASAAGGTGGCIDVCGLYGPPCCVWSEGCIEPGGSCVVDLLSVHTDTSLAYEYADLEQKIASGQPEVVTSFTDADIAWAAADPPSASRIEMHMTLEASSRQGTVMENKGGYFRFSCGGQSLFVGVIYNIMGAAALNTPVLYVDRDAENLVVLRLGAWQGAWWGSASMEDPRARERIDRPEIRAVFCQRGALRELDPDASFPSDY
jgi:hypothetical protein